MYRRALGEGCELPTLGTATPDETTNAMVTTLTQRPVICTSCAIHRRFKPQRPQPGSLSVGNLNGPSLAN